MQKPKRSSQTQVLYLSRNTAALVHLHRQGQGDAVKRVDTQAVSVADDGLPAWSVAVGAMDAKAEGGKPLTVCLADELVLYRVISLPSTEPRVFEQMIEGQAEAALPGPVDRLAWSWTTLVSPQRTEAGPTADPPPRRVLLCAVRRDLLDRAKDAARVLGEPRSIFPSGTTLAALVSPPTSESRTSTAIVHLATGHTTLLVLRADHIVACAAVDGGADDWADESSQDKAGPMQSWSNELADLWQHMAGDIPTDLQPQRGLLLNDEGESNQPTIEATKRAIGLPTSAWSAQSTISYAGDLACDLPPPAPPLGAIAAGLSQLRAATRTLDLNPMVGGGKSKRGPRAWLIASPLRLAALVVWINIILGLFYVADRREADRLEAAVSQQRVSRDEIGGSATHQRFSDYLRQTTIPPLPLLEAMADDLPENILLQSWRYNREETRLHISGKSQGRDVERVQKLLAKLNDSDLFMSVELDSAQRVSRNEWSFEITAHIAPLFRYMAVETGRESASQTGPQSEPDSPDSPSDSKFDPPPAQKNSPKPAMPDFDLTLRTQTNH